METKKKSKVSGETMAPMTGAICSAAETQAVVSEVMSVNKNGSEKAVLIGSRVADWNSDAAKKRNYLLDDWDGGVFSVQRNNFNHKSLSSFSANPVVGCGHACPHCYVGEIVMRQKAKLAKFGVQDPAGQWGEYTFLREWDEKKFLASVKKADAIRRKDLNKDGNRAVMYSTTTDAYQVFRFADRERQNEMNQKLREMVRKSLEIIRDNSSLNVRVLTRSPLSRLDFDLYQSYGKRLMFGMSVPTLDNELSKAYEPQSPSPTKRLETLKAAKEMGLHVFVAMAPLFPDCDEDDIRRTLMAFKELDVMTIFLEPINVRADNVQRMIAIGRQHGKELKLGVFDSPEQCREYGFNQLKLVQRIARELGIEGRLHLWPDDALTSEAQFMKMREAIFRRNFPEAKESRKDTAKRKRADLRSFKKHLAWVNRWHARVSEWPGKKPSKRWKVPALPDGGVLHNTKSKVKR